MFLLCFKHGYDRRGLKVKYLKIFTQGSVTWYGLNYAGMQITQQDFQNKGTLAIPAWLFFDLKVPLCYLRPSIIWLDHAKGLYYGLKTIIISDTHHIRVVWWVNLLVVQKLPVNCLKEWMTLNFLLLRSTITLKLGFTR